MLHHSFPLFCYLVFSVWNQLSFTPLFAVRFYSLKFHHLLENCTKILILLICNKMFYFAQVMPFHHGGALTPCLKKWTLFSQVSLNDTCSLGKVWIHTFLIKPFFFEWSLMKHQKRLLAVNASDYTQTKSYFNWLYTDFSCINPFSFQFAETSLICFDYHAQQSLCLVLSLPIYFHYSFALAWPDKLVSNCTV